MRNNVKEKHHYNHHTHTHNPNNRYVNFMWIIYSEMVSQLNNFINFATTDIAAHHTNTRRTLERFQSDDFEMMFWHGNELKWRNKKLSTASVRCSTNGNGTNNNIAVDESSIECRWRIQSNKCMGINECASGWPVTKLELKWVWLASKGTLQENVIFCILYAVFSEKKTIGIIASCLIWCFHAFMIKIMRNVPPNVASVFPKCTAMEGK